MEKKIFLAVLFVAATAWIANTFAAGNSNILTLVKPRTMAAYGYDSVILKIITTTPNNKQLNANEIKIFAGQSCSALANVFDFVPPNNEPFTVSAGEDELTSSDLGYAFGNGLGCFKVDITVKEKVVSTGAIQLIWKDGRYVAAIPSSISMHF